MTPLETANLLLTKLDSGASHMKLQKLVYLIHAYWLQENDDRIVSADPQVWQFGPVFGGLYHRLKDNRTNLINEPVPDYGDETAVVPDEEAVSSLVDRVLAKYGNKTGGELSDLTHKPGSPWHTMAKKYEFRVPQGLAIPEDIIRSHYRTEISQLR